MTPPVGDGDWTRPSREQWESIHCFLDAAAGVPPDQWVEPVAPGRWSPAQVAEHVVRTYEVGAEQVRTGTGMRPRAGPILQRLLRWFLLPHVIYHRSLPLRARAPREVKPSEAGVPQGDLPRLLRDAAAGMEREFRGAVRTHVFHAYFGPIELPRAMRFLAVHTDHHRKQLVGSRRPPTRSRA
jgi:hypothetical protein